MDSLIVLIMLVFLVIGIGYGVGAKTITSMVDGIDAVTKTFAGLSGLIFLLFVISQFLAYFNYSNIATVVAVDLGDALEHVNLGAIPLLLGFITITGAVGMLIVGAIPKWAIFAPIFVPLFMKLGIAPEVVLAAYRVGDFAAERHLAADAIFRADCRVCAALSERGRSWHRRGDDAALRGGDLGRLDPALPGLGSARAALRAQLNPTARHCACPQQLPDPQTG